MYYEVHQELIVMFPNRGYNNKSIYEEINESYERIRFKEELIAYVCHPHNYSQRN
jgi:hypothetical protein